jgi:hypothetical protein
MAIERIPKDYNAATYEKIISSLVRRIEVLENAKTVKKIGSLASGAAPLLEIGEPGYVRSDDSDIDLVLRADDGKIYRFSGIVSTSSSVVTTPAGVFVLKTGDTMTGLLTLSGLPTADLHAAGKGYTDQTAKRFSILFG